MNKLSLKQRLGAVSAALSGLLMVSGCHYNGGTSSSANSYHDYDSNSAPPFYRTFPQSQPYDGNPQGPTPDQMPPSVLPNRSAPSVLPAPGYSEPNDIPPAPSVQRSKWNLFPNGLKFPGFNRQKSQVDQASSKNANQDFSLRTGHSKALPELSGTPVAVKRSTATTKDSDDGVTSVRSVSKSDDESTPLPQLKRSAKSSSTVARQWPAPVAAPRVSTTESAPAESEGTTSTKSTPSGRGSTGDVPMLLPPPL